MLQGLGILTFAPVEELKQLRVLPPLFAAESYSAAARR
jgi:hypothetical protein